jgi:hypothetical protein
MVSIVVYVCRSRQDLVWEEVVWVAVNIIEGDSSRVVRIRMGNSSGKKLRTNGIAASQRSEGRKAIPFLLGEREREVVVEAREIKTKEPAETGLALWQALFTALLNAFPRCLTAFYLLPSTLLCRGGSGSPLGDALVLYNCKYLSSMNN